MQKAIFTNNTSLIFDWLMTAFSFQGISDRVAQGYIDRNGNASWASIASGLARLPPCPLLKNFWSYDGCRYDKLSSCCSEPEHSAGCCVPTHRLRNGRLNQMAYSLFFFMRDIARNDFVGWVDNQIADARKTHPQSRVFHEALVEPMKGIYGVSDKILTMALSTMLLSSDRPGWFDLGAQTAVIDSLVHNFMHRTGTLRRFDANHAYGPACYGPGKCADIIGLISAQIDARKFNRRFPSRFTRFIQHGIWRHCAADALDTCNGHQIDDRKSCQNRGCCVFAGCSKIALKPS
ncbi:MAG: hypothetical protein NTZ72_01135 [Afipia sp.]|nr:hypothetical protein [Afipia sp.]